MSLLSLFETQGFRQCKQLEDERALEAGRDTRVLAKRSV